MSDGEPTLIEVELFGTKVNLPEAEAKAVLASRDETKKRLTDLQGQLDSKTAAEEQARLEADAQEKERIAKDAEAKGDVAQLKSLHMADLQQKDSLIKKYQIQDVLAKSDMLNPTALGDVTASLLNDPSTTIEGDPPLVKKADGTTSSLDEYVKQWLTSHQHFAKAVKTPSSGAEGSPDIDPNIPVITRAEFDKNPSKYTTQVRDKKIIVKD